jgi:CBS domain-containing protein
MLIREAMTPGARCTGLHTPLVEAARLMRDESIGCLLVGDANNVVGILTDRDICGRAVANGRDPNKTTVRDAMSKGLTWCRDDDPLEEAARLMAEKQVHHLPVRNEAGKLAGILSLADVARSRSIKQPQLWKLVSRDADRHAIRAA